MMIQPTEKFYAMVCFLTIISTNTPWNEKAPGYLGEKHAMLDEGLDAFGYLDFGNMQKVVSYLLKFRIDVPQIWTDEIDAQIQAARELLI